MRLILLLSLNSFVFLSSSLIAQTNLGTSNSDQTFKLKIESAIDSARTLYLLDNESELAYKLGKYACLEAEKSQNLDLINKAYHFFINHNNIIDHYQENLKYSKKAVELNDKIDGNFNHWQALIDLTKVYRSGYFYKKAVETSQLSLAVSESLNDDSVKCVSYLEIGQALNGNNQKLDAFRYLFNATKIAEESGSSYLVFDAYTVMAIFYNFEKGHDRALNYNNIRLKLWRDCHPNDSSKLYDIYLFGEEVNFFSNNNEVNEDLLDEILVYAKRNGDQNLNRRGFTLLRSHLIEDLNFKKLSEIYDGTFSEEFDNLREERPALYAKVRACIYEYRQQIDSSIFYYNISEELIKKQDNKILVSNFYLRYGQFLSRQKKYKEAIPRFESAFYLADSVSYFPYMLLSSKELHQLYSFEGNHEKAYHFSLLHQNLSDSLALMTRDDELIVMEFSKEMEKDSIARVKERYETEQKHREVVENKRRQNRTLGVIGLFVLLLAVGLFSRLRYMRRSKEKIQKEKNRSERLLLNILPKDIAEELKSKGKAEARKFESVSILFTDFKNFTLAAEQLRAIDLVEEINQYFELFDEITTVFRIEKIKTIGDAYMAAGGIPRTFQDSTKRTVLAALKMQEKIGELNKKKLAANEHVFEMRIGIHTGPVVAGIVGAKKFQYDVWGDTVNTAARMEQSGEIGKVNISEDTYNMIKDEPEFEFESRGRVKAKNKGDVQMYYVQLRPSKHTNK